MALARALTKRTKRNRGDSNLARGGSVRVHGTTIDRNLISLPTQLISTTNINALNAPDIGAARSSPSKLSLDTATDSDFSHSSGSFLDSPATTPDSSSVESSPVSRDSFKGFFDAVPPRSPSRRGNRPSDGFIGFETPILPQRAPSHSKKAHLELSHRRSMQRLSPPPTAIAGLAPRRSIDSFIPSSSDPDHPFVRELAQVNEVAEEFGVTTALLDEEELELMNKGLCKFGVNDYLEEIGGLYGGIFEDQLGPMAKPWI